MNRFVLALIMLVYCLSCTAPRTQEVPLWGVFEATLISDSMYVHPFVDVDLMVKCVRPDSSIFEVYGFYDGSQTWKFRIMPDMEGLWRYQARFTDDARGMQGAFRCIESDKPGPLTVSSHNPTWLVHRSGKVQQVRSLHVGDRFFASNFDSQKRSKFLDWAEDQGYNMLSVASHYLNRQQKSRGEGWDTPKLWPLDPAEYRKLEMHLDELEARGITVFPFAGFFGRSADWPVDHQDQELYIRYTLSRLSPYWNTILNVAGPEPLLKPQDYQNGAMTAEDIGRVAELIKKYDPYEHVLSVHNRTKNEMNEYERDPFIFEPWEDYATLQGGKSADCREVYDFIIESRKVTKPIFAQEVLWYGNMYHAALDIDQLKQKAITLIMAGAFINFGDMDGNSSSGFSGCLDLDSVHVEAHTTMHTVWDLFDNLPFEDLAPCPDLAEGAFCLSNGHDRFLLYNPLGTPFKIKMDEELKGSWISAADPSNTLPAKFVHRDAFLHPPGDGDWLLWIAGDTSGLPAAIQQ